jgi:hypothetical protein
MNGPARAWGPRAGPEPIAWGGRVRAAAAFYSGRRRAQPVKPAGTQGRPRSSNPTRRGVGPSFGDGLSLMGIRHEASGRLCSIACSARSDILAEVRRLPHWSQTQNPPSKAQAVRCGCACGTVLRLGLLGALMQHGGGAPARNNTTVPCATQSIRLSPKQRASVSGNLRSKSTLR